MMPDDFRSEGIALVERVRAQVDTREGLDRLHGRRRRSRATLAVAAAAAMIAVIVGTVVLVRPPSQPVGGPLPTTSLPLTVSMALLDEFVIENEGLGPCTGIGVHAGLGQSREGALVDEAGADIETFAIGEAGELIDSQRAQALGLPTTDQACLFRLVTTSIDIARIGGEFPRIGVEEWPLGEVFEAGSSRAGQQLVYYSRGEEP